MDKITAFISKYHTYILIALAALGEFIAYAFGLTPPEWVYNAAAALGISSVRISVAQYTGVSGWKTYVLAVGEAIVGGMRAAGLSIPPEVDGTLIVLAGGTMVSAVKKTP